MSTNIKCPKCGSEFPMEEAVSEEYKKELREQMVVYKKQKDDELIKKEKELQQIMQEQELMLVKKFQVEKTELHKSLESDIRKSITGDFENQVKLLQQSNNDIEQKLKLARQNELAFLQKEKDLQTKEEELELSIQRRLINE